ncbi:MAG: large conductance mechanosensitive channel protein MscL [Bryobacteraceae bacterium]|nr:large conductance mechanosensitive channel protein MscL [Bryobacteraceae bacterium]
MMSDFKAFIMKGNVMDLAVGVIIGAAFGKIVDSLVGDIVMPIIAKVTGGGVDFSNLFTALDGKAYATLSDAKKATAVLAYGNFVTILINFLILAFVIFLMVKQVQKLMPPPAPAAPPGPSNEEVLLTQIRDLLKR